MYGFGYGLGLSVCYVYGGVDLLVNVCVCPMCMYTCVYLLTCKYYASNVQLWHVYQGDHQYSC
ncbi:hypothetical protein EON63_13820 [archaeon]|nr:MAG: hypothetical protein EON63_13820 [archaeon]